jgi:hypothetical protein
MNTTVSFELAKLLKEKGFDRMCKHIYAYGNTTTIDNLAWIDNSNDRGYYSAPTIVEVVMWLYEKHGVWVNPHFDDGVLCFYYVINTSTVRKHANRINSLPARFKSPTEAYTSAIEYVLNNLI